MSPLRSSSERSSLKGWPFTARVLTSYALKPVGTPSSRARRRSPVVQRGDRTVVLERATIPHLSFAATIPTAKSASQRGTGNNVTSAKPRRGRKFCGAVCPAKASMFSGRQSGRGRSQEPHSLGRIRGGNEADETDRQSVHSKNPVRAG